MRTVRLRVSKVVGSRVVEDSMSYQSRTGAVLFASSLDRVAIFYSRVLGLTETRRDDDHIVLESQGFQLVVHRIPGDRSAAGEITVPPTRRATAAFKPVFFVPSISNLRGVAEANGCTGPPVASVSGLLWCVLVHGAAPFSRSGMSSVPANHRPTVDGCTPVALAISLFDMPR